MINIFEDDNSSSWLGKKIVSKNYRKGLGKSGDKNKSRNTKLILNHQKKKMYHDNMKNNSLNESENLFEKMDYMTGVKHGATATVLTGAALYAAHKIHSKNKRIKKLQKINKEYQSRNSEDDYEDNQNE